jgi:two-component system LytT family response regulator
MKTLRLLIVDDEPLVRESIRNGVVGLAGVEIIEECESGSQAIDAILSKQPDLVLLDVRMQDCTGLDVVRRIGPDRMPAVIFITAYEEHAVKAFELNAVDYLLKPFDEERLHSGIRRARSRIAQRVEESLASRLEALLQTRKEAWPERLAAKNGERIDVISVDSIDWMESANNFVQLHCGTKNYLLSETVSNLANRLDPSRFLRVHRRYIVNLSRLVAIHRMLGGTYMMELRNGTRLATGRQYKGAIQAVIQNRPLEGPSDGAGSRS